MRTRHLVLTGVAVLTALCATSTTRAGTCNGEAPSDSRCLPRIIPGAPGYSNVQMDVTTATADLQAACADDIGHTVWFEIAPTVDSHITFSTCEPGTTYDTVVQGYIFIGDCEFPMRIDSWCNDDSSAASCDNGCSFRGSIVTVQATAGTTYLFEVGSFGSNAAECELCLEVSVVIGPTPPANDDCFDATPIGDTTLAFDTIGATTDGPPLPPSCDEGSGTSCVQDIWYLYTAPCTGVARVDLCGSAYDTRIAVYEPDACPGDLLVCNDDSCGLWSQAQFAVSAGSSYLIRVAGFAGAGTGTMTVACGPCVADITGPGGLGAQDGNVDALDFLAMIAQWGSPCVGSCEADITGSTPLVPDGNVDSLDFLLLVAQWGTPGNCP